MLDDNLCGIWIGNLGCNDRGGRLRGVRARAIGMMEQHNGGAEDECDGRGPGNLMAQYEKRQTRFVRERVEGVGQKRESSCSS